MGEEEQRVRSFSSETRAKSKASRQAGKRSQEKSKRVLKFVKVSTTKSKHRRHTRVLQMEKFFQKKIKKERKQRETSKTNQ
jgi:hypothetical protein